MSEKIAVAENIENAKLNELTAEQLDLVVGGVESFTLTFSKIKWTYKQL